jgi:mannose-6-phosphate isomerase-like protein (cupin superfamily)
MNKINLLEKFSLFNEQWTPKVVAELNGQHVKLAKVEGDFIWHKHESEDELFLVVKGKLTIEFRDRSVELSENEILVVPRGVEHKPVAKEEVWIMMFEPVSTLNTGNEINERSKRELEQI